jgi:hypothetical protein
MIAEHGIGNVVGGEREACDLHQQRLVRQRGRFGQWGFDYLALLQIVAGDDEIGGLHCFDPCFSHAAIFAPSDECFATAMMFKTLFGFGVGMPPRHCPRQTRSVCARKRSDEAIHLSPR